MCVHVSLSAISGAGANGTVSAIMECSINKRIRPFFCSFSAMAALLSLFGRGATTAKYGPMPRFYHVSQSVGSKVLVRGGRTNDFSEKSRQHLSSVVELFDPYSELWEKKQVEGDIPSPGTRSEASASVNNDLFTYGGVDVSGKYMLKVFLVGTLDPNHSYDITNPFQVTLTSFRASNIIS